MKQKEVTEQEFKKIDNIRNAKEMLKILKHKYQSEYYETIEDLIGYCRDMDLLDGQEPKHYSIDDIHDIFDEDNLIEYLDGHIDDEILLNYYTTKSITNEDFTWRRITQRGYVLI